MMTAVKSIRLTERVLLDPDRLVELCISMGEPAAEALVTASIDDVATGMEKLPKGFDPGKQPEVLNSVRRLSAIADHIGLRTFVRVARDIDLCIETGDTVAYSATLTRLHRVASKAQTALWDLQDMKL